jgi:hypothetical protein
MPTKARSLKFAVGRKGSNSKEDVVVVQQLLNAARLKHAKFKESAAELDVKKGYGPATEAAIAAYQEKVLGWSGAAVDGTVQPNKSTWKSLNGNVASPAKIKKAVEPRPTTVAGYTAFKQGDYKSVGLGEGKLNISGHGCALCTLTMAATLIGTPTPHWHLSIDPADLTPPIVNDILRSAGAFKGSLLVMPKAAEALGMSYVEYGKAQPCTPNDVTLIATSLLAGNPVAAHVDYKSSGIGDHWILIVERTDSAEFDAIDPATGRIVHLTSAPRSAIDGPRVTRTENIKNGVLFGWGGGGSSAQQKYVVVRFALLTPFATSFCAAM